MSKRIIRIVILIFSLIVLFAPLGANNAHAQTIPVGPNSKEWYFAEGFVGDGFKQWITIGNPNNATCTASIHYFYTITGVGNTPQQMTKSVTIQKLSRYTEFVNNDLGIPQTSSKTATLSAIVSTGDCDGIVVERPMYFNNYHGVSSGTDVLGATKPLNDWYFAEVPAGASGESFLSVFNPSTTDALVTVQYFIGGTTPISETKTVLAQSRNTFFPNDLSQLTTHQHVAVHVNSPVAIVVERPTYFSSVNGVSGAAALVGVPATACQWIFPAGTTTGTHEFLIIANPYTSPITAEIDLVSSTANESAPITQTVPGNGQIVFDVNSNNTFTGHTADVSAIVTGYDSSSVPKPILVQRELFGTYSGANKNTPSWTSTGVSDSLGIANSAQPVDINVKSVLSSKFALGNIYSFAEGFVSSDFNEYMMIFNNTNVDENISITLTNMLGEQDTDTVPVPAHSRYSFNVTSMVENSHTFTLTDPKAYAVSSSVYSDGGQFGVERVMYWNSADSSTQGTNAVPGLLGNY